MVGDAFFPRCWATESPDGCLDAKSGDRERGRMPSVASGQDSPDNLVHPEWSLRLTALFVYV